MPEPAGRFSIGFDANTLDFDVEWTHLDQVHPNLITSYSIDRGRQFELDRTDGGRASVEVIDPEGILDPTSIASPYYGLLEPLLPARLGRRNPVTGEWYDRFRGFVEAFDYTLDPSQRYGRLTMTLVDIYEILQSIEMELGPTTPPAFGDQPPPTKAGNLFFQGHPNEAAGVPGLLIQDRIRSLLGQCAPPDGLDERWAVVFTGNVYLYATVYSPGESVLTVIQETVDSEFPGLASNCYPDRHGRLCVHGRMSFFDPVGTAEEAGPTQWVFNELSAGDGLAVNAHPDTTAHIRRFAYDRGLSKIVNSATAWPARPPPEPQLTPAELAGQLVQDLTSIGRFGFRSWTSQELQTWQGLIDDTNDLVETKRYSQFIVDAFKEPHNRITEITFRSMRPDAVGATPNWDLLSRIDISDSVAVTMHGPTGFLLFNEDPFFVQGVHEEVRPLNADYDDVTLSLDLSPREPFLGSSPWT